MDTYVYTKPDVIAGYITNFGLQRICFNKVIMGSYHHKNNIEMDEIRKYLYQTTNNYRKVIFIIFLLLLTCQDLTNMA